MLVFAGADKLRDFPKEVAKKAEKNILAGKYCIRLAPAFPADGGALSDIKNLDLGKISGEFTPLGRLGVARAEIRSAILISHEESIGGHEKAG